MILTLSAASTASAQTFEWQGLYAGANAGFTFRNLNFSAVEGGPDFYNSAFDSINGPVDNGITFGGQVGYNWAVSPSLIVGGELSFGKFGYSGMAASGLFNGDTVAESSGGMGWTALGRAGYALGDRALPYFAFGYLGATNNVSIVDDCDTSPCGGGLIDIAASGMEGRYVWGFGFEYAVKPEAVRPVSIKVEWLNTDFRTFVTAEDSDLDVSWNFNTHFPRSVLRASVNIHLGR
jgi:opacity protein-like surface antigen